MYKGVNDITGEKVAIKVSCLYKIGCGAKGTIGASLEHGSLKRNRNVKKTEERQHFDAI